jgi:hypothetical protein
MSHLVENRLLQLRAILNMILLTERAGTVLQIGAGSQRSF